MMAHILLNLALAEVDYLEKICMKFGPILLINSILASSALAASFDTVDESEQLDQNLISDLNITEMTAILKENAPSSGLKIPSPDVEAPLSPSETISSSGTPKPKDFINSLHSVLSKRDLRKAYKILSELFSIKDNSLVADPSIFSVIANSVLKSKFAGKLVFNDYMEIFEPMIEGKHWNLAGGYFIALRFFHPSIQSAVLKQMVQKYPSLKAHLLIMAINFNLDENVIKEDLMASDFIITFADEDEICPAFYLPRVSRKGVGMIPIVEKSLMTFKSFSPVRLDFSFTTHPDNFINFLNGLVKSHSMPDEIGALRAAFENYSPDFVNSFLCLCPNQVMAKYHLAHLIAQNPRKAQYFPLIQDLVDLDIVFGRLNEGEADLVAIALLSFLPEEDQIQKITTFLGKTNIFGPSHRAISRRTSPDFATSTGIKELPLNDAASLLNVAFKWNIADKAFSAIWARCKPVLNRMIYAVRDEALRYEEKPGNELFSAKFDILKKLN